MNWGAIRKTGRNSAETAEDVAAGALKASIFVVVMGVALFASAGTLEWPLGWVWIGAGAVSTVVVSLLMDPSLLQERAQAAQGAQPWDIVLALMMGRFGWLAMLIVAGLDKRFGWYSSVPLPLLVVGFILLALGYVVSDWAAVANRFFSGVVRIQKDRGHTVVTDGPYRLMRHPGYTGASLVYLATPLVLGSWWAFVPAGLAVAVTIVRTALEDGVLRAELPGYAEYAEDVRWRLLPGVW